MAQPLVIVESPAKAKTISQILGSGFTVRASIGHIADLPSSGLCVDVENDFKLTYEVKKKDVVRDLKAALKQADELYLATDEDREGEAIAWHLLEALKPTVPVKRMVFHEITKAAIERAVRDWRAIDYGLVDAQETRRTLDRLYGYEVSPVLWRKVGPSLSAGRVQSPAVRLIVQRERERMRFRAAGYWDLEAGFATAPAFSATLVSVDDHRVATGKDFDEQGRPRTDDVLVLDEAAARALVDRLQDSRYDVSSLDERPYRSSPKPPFITSTLQQEGARKLGLSAQQVMRVAQSLYEQGYITYMRTDSTTLSEEALSAARRQVQELYGAPYLPPQARQYTRKVKNAQEAHEAIRPAGDSWRTAEQLSGELAASELRLYDLIWKRTVASQMADASGTSVSVRIAAASSAGERAEFAASGRTITFPGYLRAYVEGSDDPEAELEDRELPLPALTVGQTLPLASLLAKGHTTSPPPRYTEASLVKRLEELGIGRPSTYASIMGSIQSRYVWKKGQALVPSWTAFAVINLLERHFDELVDFTFTARMEDDLDEIANGGQQKVPWLRKFYFGNGTPGLHSLVHEGLGDIDAAEINAIPIGVDDEGVEIVVKPGRYGPYVKRLDETASVPDDLAPDELTVERALELLRAPKGDTPLGEDPETGLPVYAKSGRFGPYVQLGDAEHPPPGEKKPKMASLFASMSLDTLTIEQAMRLLSLPRVVGLDPADGVEIIATNGRFGPFIKKGEETRNLDSEDAIFTVTLDDALARLAEPKTFRGRGRGAPKPPLAELGPDPVSGRAMVVKEGRFGPYVTDGETNASLRKGDDPATVTPERGSELLQLRRETADLPKPRKAPARAGTEKGLGVRKVVSKKATSKKAAPAKKAPAAKKTAAAKKAGG